MDSPKYCLDPATVAVILEMVGGPQQPHVLLCATSKRGTGHYVVHNVYVDEGHQGAVRTRAPPKYFTVQSVGMEMGSWQRRYPSSSTSADAAMAAAEESRSGSASDLMLKSHGGTYVAGRDTSSLLL